MELRKVAITILRAKPFEKLTVGAILSGLLVACLLAAAILYLLAIPHRIRARAFLRDFSSLRLGESTFEQAQEIARRYGGIPWYVDSGDMRCLFERCVFAFQFDNMPLSYVPFVGYTRFFASVSIKDGIVVKRDLAYSHVSKRDYFGFNYEVWDGLADTGGQATRSPEYGVARYQIDPSGAPRVLRVRLRPTSNADLRRAAYSLDLACLASLFGCTRPSGFFPSGLRNWIRESPNGAEP